MKQQYFMVGLATVVLVLGLWAGLQSVRYYFVMRQLAVAQGQVNQVQLRLNYAQALATEALEYSRRNSAIDPILQQFNFKPKPQNSTAPAAPKPAAK